MDQKTWLLFLLLSLISSGSSIHDLTRQPYAAGEHVVDAVIAVMDNSFPGANSTLWREGDDSVFFKDLALVESNYGRDNHTFTTAHLGGIWQVTESAFEKTQNVFFVRRNQEYRDKIDAISDTLFISWLTVSFDELTMPLYSFIAARLVLHVRAIEAEENSCGSIPPFDEKEAYAEYWYVCYRESMRGHPDNFTAKIDPEVCSITSDVVFVLDASGSINYAHPDNWNRVKYFTGNFTADLLRSTRTSTNQNRVGIVTYSSNARIYLNLTGDQELLLETISDLFYDDCATNTAEGLCQLLDIDWRDDALRLVILMTDGRSNRESPLCGTTLEAPVFVNSQLCPEPLYYVIGVTDNVNDTELHAIATGPQYIDHLDSLQNIEGLSEFRRHRTYEICFKASSFVCDRSEDIISKTNFGRGDRARYQIDVEQGATVRLCLSNGQVALYGSVAIPNPNRAFNTFSFEQGLLTGKCEDIFVEPGIIDLVQSRDDILNSFKGRKRRQTEASSEQTIFVTIEGIAANSSFTFEVIPGNSSIYSTSCANDPCGANTVCVDEVIGYSCVCQEGYEFQGNLQDCREVNECEREPFPCHTSAYCVDTVGSFKCTCHPGYVGDGQTCALYDNTHLQLILIVACSIGGAVIVLLVLVAAFINVYLTTKRKKNQNSNSDTSTTGEPDSHLLESTNTQSFVTQLSSSMDACKQADAKI